MFTEKVDLKDFEKQDPEYQDLLRRVLSIQADCEIGGPISVKTSCRMRQPLDQLDRPARREGWTITQDAAGLRYRRRCFLFSAVRTKIATSRPSR
jgi:hypothetical protein